MRAKITSLRSFPSPHHTGRTTLGGRPSFWRQVLETLDATADRYPRDVELAWLRVVARKALREMDHNQETDQ